MTVGVLALLLIASLSAGAPAISIQLEGGVFKVAGWNAPSSAPARGWESVFAVYTGPADAPPLLGTYTVERATLQFHPRFPFAAGMRYRAIFRSSAGGAPIEKIFDGPPAATVAEARIESVYPSAPVLPSNILRLYVYFSAPMSRGEAAAHLHILDSKGKVLEGIFLPGEELWDPAGRRLTMTFDPGRIKRGLTSNQAMGPPIAEGKLYTLVIDRAWRDARGVPMTEGLRKTFRGGPAIRMPPDPKTWRIAPPQAGASGGLTIAFPEPMNYALLQRMIEVRGPRGVVPGTVSIGHDEMEWRFNPRDRWEAGSYRVVVDTAIEDLAGNHIGQPFDIDVFEHVTEHIATQTISLPFAITR